MVPVLLRLDDLCALDKPSGMLVHSSRWAGPREHTLVDEAHKILGEGFHPLHRLDRGTSGVVVFARADRVAALQEALAKDTTDKRYWALVRGHILARVEVDHAIVDEESGVVREARSIVTPLLQSTVERCSLVEVQLLTGRRHQARRHLKHLSHPVIGDASHGKGPLNREYRERWGMARLGLHARSLVFFHPLDGARIQIEARLPADFRDPLVRMFGDEIARLEGPVPTSTLNR